MKCLNSRRRREDTVLFASDFDFVIALRRGREVVGRKELVRSKDVV